MIARQLQKRQREETPKDVQEQDGKAARTVAKRLSRRVGSAAAQFRSKTTRVTESVLFRPVKQIGLIADGLAFSHTRLGDDNFMAVSVGKGFQVFNSEKLLPVYIGPCLNEPIRALLTIGETVLTSLEGSAIVAWHKLVELGRFCGHTETATALCSLGSSYLISASSKEVLVWQLSDVATKEANTGRAGECVLGPLGELATAPEFGACTVICHLPTYLHKVLLAYSSGALMLWNVRTRERIHNFKAHRANFKSSNAVTCLCEVPTVLDLVAIGFASGRICVLNAREDRVIAEFDQAQGRVTALTFRTGSGAPAHLVSGTPSGAFVVWDLNKRRAHHVHDEAHHGPINSLSFLPDQPLLVTGSNDNSIRMWIFDTADGLPRLLRSRCGCPGPPTRIQFYDDDDHDLIAAGYAESAGFVANISFILQSRNKEYPQSALRKLPAAMRTGASPKAMCLPPVVDSAFSRARHFDWPAIITAHEGMDSVFIWSALHQALAPKVLRPADVLDCAPVTAVAVSPCGSYCVIGLMTGALHRFNLQSQLHRGQIPQSAEGASESAGTTKRKRIRPPPAHSGRVCGVAITVSGQVLSVSSHPDDCNLHYWNLQTHRALGSVALGNASTGAKSCLLLRVHSSFVAVALDDGSLVVVDLTGKSVVRTFSCGVPASDVAFSSEGRWLAAALRSGGVRVFDLPAARCIDFFTCELPVTSVCFTPSTSYLLTAHSRSTSVQVWANKHFFDPSLSAPLLRAEPTQPVHMGMITDLALDASDDESEDDADDDGDDAEVEIDAGGSKKQIPADQTKEDAICATATPLEPQLLTLSDVHPSKWLATLHLDLVKERNKPAAPPAQAPDAPFFFADCA